jgi:hypothetical protein
MPDENWKRIWACEDFFVDIEETKDEKTIRIGKGNGSYCFSNHGYDALVQVVERLVKISDEFASYIPFLYVHGFFQEKK